MQNAAYNYLLAQIMQMHKLFNETLVAKYYKFDNSINESRCEMCDLIGYHKWCNPRPDLCIDAAGSGLCRNCYISGKLQSVIGWTFGFGGFSATVYETAAWDTDAYCDICQAETINMPLVWYVQMPPESGGIDIVCDDCLRRAERIKYNPAPCENK
jgi:hypothetical protein